MKSAAAAKLTFESLFTLHRHRIAITGALGGRSLTKHMNVTDPETCPLLLKNRLAKSLILGQDPRKHQEATHSISSPSLELQNCVESPLFAHLNSYHTARSDTHISDTVSHGHGEAEETCKNKSNLIVVLDMDECLIHSQFLSTTVDQYRQSELRPTSDPDHNITHSEACESFHFYIPNTDELILVRKRPHLDAFLHQVTQRFDTFIFTAAVEDYAKPLLDILDPKGILFAQRFYRNSCTFDPELGVYIKNLYTIIPSIQCHHKRHLSNTTCPPPLVQEDDGPSKSSSTFAPCIERRVVLVDNNPMSFLIANPSNGILVSNFYDDAKDSTLEAVWELLLELDQSDDVRPILDAKFGLKDALKGITG